MLQVTLPYLMMDVINNNPIKKSSTTKSIMDFLFPQNPTHDLNNWSNTSAELASHVEILNQSALLSVSDLKGNIIHANELFCSVSKYELSELLNKPHSIIRHPDTSPEVFKDMWKTIKSGKVWQGELKNKAKDGSCYWVVATVAPVFGEDGKPIRYISIRYDISKQKQIEEELRVAKNKIDHELMENIRYAKHIHGALLCTNEPKVSLDESFLIYREQKLISGDFYTINRNDSRISVVVGDSTGHGISASYISVLALNTLSRIMDFSCENPAKVLEVLNTELNKITRHNKSKKLTESADVFACCVDKANMRLNYASAKIKAFIIRDGETILLEKENVTIGEIAPQEFQISNKSIPLQSGDSIYIISDGIIDQFGGQKNKRVGFKKIISLLEALQDFPMSMQKRKIEEFLLEWQGNNEQTDDMTMFGIRV